VQNGLNDRLIRLGPRKKRGTQIGELRKKFNNS